MGKRILLVEDDGEQRMLYQMVMNYDGYDVQAVTDGLTALQCLDHQSFDLVVTDWFLPDINGDRLVAETHRLHPGVKAVLISNHDQLREAARAAGADGWYRKSDDLCHLEKVIAGLLH